MLNRTCGLFFNALKSCSIGVGAFAVPYLLNRPILNFWNYHVCWKFTKITSDWRRETKYGDAEVFHANPDSNVSSLFSEGFSCFLNVENALLLDCFCSFAQFRSRSAPNELDLRPKGHSLVLIKYWKYTSSKWAQVGDWAFLASKITDMCILLWILLRFHDKRVERTRTVYFFLGFPDRKYKSSTYSFQENSLNLWVFWRPRGKVKA